MRLASQYRALGRTVACRRGETFPANAIGGDLVADLGRHAGGQYRARQCHGAVDAARRLAGHLLLCRVPFAGIGQLGLSALMGRFTGAGDDAVRTHPCIAGNLLFAALFTRFGKSFTDDVSTLINFLMFGLGFALQWGIGLVVNRLSHRHAGPLRSCGLRARLHVAVGLQAICVVWTLLPFAQRRGTQRRAGAAVNIALRIVEIVLPVLVIIVMGYAIGRLWNKPDMRVVNRLNLDVFGPFWCWPTSPTRA